MSSFQNTHSTQHSKSIHDSALFVTQTPSSLVRCLNEDLRTQNLFTFMNPLCDPSSVTPSNCHVHWEKKQKTMEDLNTSWQIPLDHFLFSVAFMDWLGSAFLFSFPYVWICLTLNLVLSYQLLEILNLENSLERYLDPIPFISQSSVQETEITLGSQLRIKLLEGLKNFPAEFLENTPKIILIGPLKRELSLRSLTVLDHAGARASTCTVTNASRHLQTRWQMLHHCCWEMVIFSQPWLRAATDPSSLERRPRFRFSESQDMLYLMHLICIQNPSCKGIWEK